MKAILLMFCLMASTAYSQKYNCKQMNVSSDYNVDNVEELTYKYFNPVDVNTQTKKGDYIAAILVDTITGSGTRCGFLSLHRCVTDIVYFAILQANTDNPSNSIDDFDWVDTVAKSDEVRFKDTENGIKKYNRLIRKAVNQVFNDRTIQQICY